MTFLMMTFDDDFDDHFDDDFDDHFDDDF